MAGTIKTNAVQLGDSATATQNFHLRTNVDGTATLARGNVGAPTQDILTVDASGVAGLPIGQLKFPAAQNPSSDVNTLDDYEEGTWTPTFAFTTPGTSSFTYVTQIGTYTKVGRVVTVGYHITISGYSAGTASGTLCINGIPFTSAAAPVYYAGPVGYSVGFTSIFPTAAMCPPSSAFLSFYTQNPASATTQPGPTNVTSTADVYGSVTYFAAA